MKLDQIRWDSVAKIGAGALVAVALATSLPSLLGSEEPKPLPADVGLPQAAPPIPPPPLPEPKRPAKRPKHRHRHKPPAEHGRKRHRPRARGPAPAPVTTPAIGGPSGSAEDFGFERP